MIFSTEASIEKLAVHRVGNKQLDEGLFLSAGTTAIDDDTLKELLFRFFTSPFEKVNEIYRCWHPAGDLGLNEVYHFAKAIFASPGDFHEAGCKLARHLYDITSHPRIRGGELYVVYFNNLQAEGELLQAIGLFKSETKESYLKPLPGDSITLQYEQEAINIKKLDKGCLIFNTEEEQGYKVAVVDQTNKGTEAAYWLDDFLKLRIRNDAFTQTTNVMGIYKKFVTDQVDEVFDVTKADKIDLLNRSINYFKENDEFSLEEFSEQVIGHPDGIREFKRFKQQQEQAFDMPVADHFEINGAALKKQVRSYKSVLKLDRNFHIYIHGNREMIERGFDEERNMSYYKVYFKEEQ